MREMRTNEEDECG